MIKFCIGKILFFTIFLVSQFSVFSQAGFKVYVAIDDRGSDASSYIEKKNIGEAIIIYGKDIYPNNPLEVNETSLRAAIIKSFPNRNSEGIGVLDWEGKAFLSLTKGKRNSSFKKASSGFLKALAIAKKLRPNVKWGYYGIPFRRALYSSDKQWFNANEEISDILKSSDALFPNFYRINSLSIENNQAGILKANQNAIGKYAELYLQVAKRFSKPIFGFAWHRFMGHDPKFRYKKLDKSDFLYTIKSIKNASYNGRRFDGIVWWSRDARFYRAKYDVVTKEARNIDEFKVSYDKMIVDYLEQMLKM